MKLLFILFLFFKSLSFAETSKTDCSSIDLRSNFFLVMRNQKSLAWCFAHSAADNLQYTDRSQQQISAADIAINYSKSSYSKLVNLMQQDQSDGDGNSPRQFGLTRDAAQMIINEGGYCPESYFPSEDWIKINNDNTAETVELRLAVDQIYQLQNKIHSDVYTQENQLPFYYKFKHISKETFFKLLRNNKKENLLEVFRKTACDASRIPFKNKMKIVMKTKMFDLFSRLNDFLSRNKSVSVDVYSQIFRNIDDNSGSIKNLHSVLLYGRQFNTLTNQCEYLIKNSYSESCSRYDSRLRCDRGYLWFPEKVLKKNMTSAVYFN